MFFSKILSENLTEDEALVVLGSLGFTCLDWFFLHKIGGAKVFLESDLCQKIVLKKCAQNPLIEKFLEKFKETMNIFYEHSGSLITKNNFQNQPLFKSKQAPLVFFARNFSPAHDNSKTVSIVGSRNATSKALLMTEKLAFSLSSYGIKVVSGGALGVDLKAHEGSLKEKGGSVAVLGSKVALLGDERSFRLLSIDKKFPSITPFGPCETQGKYMFVERNIFVASMSKALVIVQGMEGSGTLHTALFAKKLNIPIYVIPGDIDNPQSYVPNMLLAKKEAEPIFDFDFFAECMAEEKREIKTKIKIKQPVKEIELPEILQLIKNHEGALSLSEIVTLSKKSLADVQDLLLDYELEGRLIKQGAQFVLANK